MEQLTQKYIKYFYATVICVMSVQLGSVIISTLGSGLRVDAVILMLLYALNIVLFGNCMKHNVNQRFIECEMDLKLLRATIIPLTISQIWFCVSTSFHPVTLMDHLGIAILTELILTYRIKSLDHLKNLVDHYMKYERKGGCVKCLG